MPKGSAMQASNSGWLKRYSKGDMVENTDKIEGYYVRDNGYPDSNPNNESLAPAGWYLIENVSGINGSMLDEVQVSSNTFDFKVELVFIQQGQPIRYAGITVHTKTIQYEDIKEKQHKSGEFY